MTTSGLAELAKAEREEPVASIHAAQRTLALWFLMVVCSTLFVAGLGWSALSARVGVTVRDGIVSVVPFLAAVTLAGLVYHRMGARTRWYAVADKFEGLIGSWAVAHLIHASGRAASFFWFFHMIQVLMTSAGGISAIYALTVISGPTYLTIAFAADGDGASAWQSALAGLLGLAIYLNFGRIHTELDQSRRREFELRKAVAALRVDQERARIARDLHDSVATDLTAMVWKTRELAAQVPDHARAGLEALEERLRGAIDELRVVVQSLRGEQLTFAEASALLEQRCRELAGGIPLTFSIAGECAAAQVDRFRLVVLPVCFELVRNAAEHAGARHIEVKVDCGEPLVLSVRDDGTGLERAAWLESRGGLSSARERIASLGGNIDLVPQSPGTELTVRLPRPLGTPRS